MCWTVLKKLFSKWAVSSDWLSGVDSVCPVPELAASLKVNAKVSGDPEEKVVSWCKAQWIQPASQNKVLQAKFSTWFHPQKLLRFLMIATGLNAGYLVPLKN